MQNQLSHCQHSCHQRSCRHNKIKQDINVDYFIVGGGPAALVAASDLSKALKEIHSNKSIAVIEKSASVGGQFEAVDLV